MIKPNCCRRNMWKFVAYCASFASLYLLMFHHVFPPVTNVAKSTSEFSMPFIWDTSLGEFKGVRLKSKTGTLYNSFRGIPYAEPPVGELRFKPPIAVEKYNFRIDATKEGPLCIHFNFISQQIVGQEDCLLLNIFSPEKADRMDTRLAVMVYIEGGGFLFGSVTTDVLGPEKLLDKDVIVVTLHYRLGPFGFLSTKDEHCPGNNGLLDQILALQWVHDNIAEFGGDPTRVTLVGHSTGSVAVMHHLVSPLAQGLFHRVILQSGCAFCDWTLHEQNRKLTNTIADHLQCPNKHPDMMNCLREKDANEILTVSLALPPLKPIVDDNVNGYMPHCPLDIIQDGRIKPSVPVILGVNKDEGACIYAAMPSQIQQTDPKYLDSGLPVFLARVAHLSQALIGVTEAVKREYFQNVNMSNENQVRTALVQVYTDYIFHSCCDLSVKILSEAGFPLYVYLLTHRGKYSYTNTLGYYQNLGVSHFDELQYLFESNSVSSEILTGDDAQLSDTFVTLWTNFAKSGDPTPKFGYGTTDLSFTWTQSTIIEPNFLKIKSKPRMESGHLSNNTHFWVNQMNKIPELRCSSSHSGSNPR